MSLPSDPQHDDSCDEWCNHCEVCGTPILYGSRCHDHPLVCAVVAREGFDCSCRLGVGHLLSDHLCRCGYSWEVAA